VPRPAGRRRTAPSDPRGSGATPWTRGRSCLASSPSVPAGRAARPGVARAGQEPRDRRASSVPPLGSNQHRLVRTPAIEKPRRSRWQVGVAPWVTSSIGVRDAVSETAMGAPRHAAMDPDDVVESGGQRRPPGRGPSRPRRAGRRGTAPPAQPTRSARNTASSSCRQITEASNPLSSSQHSWSSTVSGWSRSERGPVPTASS